MANSRAIAAPVEQPQAATPSKSDAVLATVPSFRFELSPVGGLYAEASGQGGIVAVTIPLILIIFILFRNTPLRSK